MTKGHVEKIAVIGLWHLGCSIAASWAKLGHQVVAIDENKERIQALRENQPPIYEPGLQETMADSAHSGRLAYSSSFKDVQGCQFVFVAYDTPVDDEDVSDTSIIDNAVKELAAHLSPGAIVAISSQVPAGTCQKYRDFLKSHNADVELICVPENLRLGDAINCYLNPGHTIIGATSKEAAERACDLFSKVNGECIVVGLASAEMCKHAINAFLATTITFANQMADICQAVGADFSEVAHAIKNDPRIGKKSYLSAGLGFSGGTLGRDLRTLSRLNEEVTSGESVLFGDLWRYNKSRQKVVKEVCKKFLNNFGDKVIGILGVTYKAGTSTLRRSMALEIAQDLISCGAQVRAFDPKADWTSASIPKQLVVLESPYAVTLGADMVIVATEWPEFNKLDFKRIRSEMKGKTLYDPKNALFDSHQELKQIGFQVVAVGRPHE